MTTVRDFYKQDDADALCIPRTNKPLECAFSDATLVTDFGEKLDLLTKYGFVLDTLTEAQQNEASDFIKEYPVFLLQTGTILCHVTLYETGKTISYSHKTQEINVADTLGWWTKALVGQSKYRGGWFTYETKYGGPEFGLNLYYRVERDVPLLFVPNHRPFYDGQKSNEEEAKSYYPNEAIKQDVLSSMLKEEIDDFTGSHIVVGVKDWLTKNYPPIQPKYYADQFAKRLAKLGFPGYISCDECEVYLTHKTMRTSLPNKPFRVEIDNDLGNFQDVFDETLRLLCGESTDMTGCPHLQITQGSRGETHDIKTLKLEQFTPLSQERIVGEFTLSDVSGTTKVTWNDDKTKTFLNQPVSSVVSQASQGRTITKLIIEDYNNITSISDLPDTVSSLDINGCESLETISLETVTSLRFLTIQECSNFRNLILPTYNKLTRLVIIDCDSIVRLPELPKTLSNLLVINCKELISLTVPKEVIGLTIRNCPKLQLEIEKGNIFVLSIENSPHVIVR